MENNIEIMNFREKAASFVLCNDDITEALELLDNASDISDTIPDEVIVWEKFEYDSIENIVEYIDTIETMLKEAYDEGSRICDEDHVDEISQSSLFDISNINWKLLKKQKLDLLNLMDRDIDVNIDSSLQGIINLLGSIQDFAVDQMGIPEKEVFNLENE